MASIYDRLFDDEIIIKRVKNKLPYLFQLAELESSRNGKIGMEIGSVRERILIALLMYKFGIDIVNPEIPITAPEVDVIVQNEPLSIKTMTTTSQRWNSVKLIWTVDAQKSQEFKDNYTPFCAMLIAKIRWDNWGKLLLFSHKSQIEILNQIGRDNYIKLPKKNTNSRGVEISTEALNLLENHQDTKQIEINFMRRKIDYREVYTKWLDAWSDEY